jgi:3-methyladenine DNA glycosylase AlkD
MLEALNRHHHKPPDHQSRFHKRDYAEDDVFVGITNPEIRAIVNRQYREVDDDELETLLTHTYHEYRLAGLLVLVKRMEKATHEDKTVIVDTYLSHTDCVNNWDLVDLSAPQILGRHCHEKGDYGLLFDLAESDDLWENRIAVVGMQHPIKQGVIGPALDLIASKLDHGHDLMHKACGWMLREIGKQDRAALNAFIKEHYDAMPRTTLRYAIEKHDENERQHILKGDLSWM